MIKRSTNFTIYKGRTVMNNSSRHILIQLEIILNEYPEAEFYIQEKMRALISDLLNSETLLDEFQQQQC